MNSSILKQTAIESLIHEIRGQKVMLDFDLAELYQVETKRLKESVRRNIERFEGDDFMFELTSEEYNSLIISLRSQIATSNERGGRRHMPFAFTEQGFGFRFISAMTPILSNSFKATMPISFSPFLSHQLPMRV